VKLVASTLWGHPPLPSFQAPFRAQLTPLQTPMMLFFLLPLLFFLLPLLFFLLLQFLLLLLLSLLLHLLPLLRRHMAKWQLIPRQLLPKFCLVRLVWLTLFRRPQLGKKQGQWPVESRHDNVKRGCAFPAWWCWPGQRVRSEEWE